MYGKSLPVTGMAMVGVGGVAVVYPIAAAIIGVAVLAAGLALRFIRPNRLGAKK